MDLMSLVGGEVVVLLYSGLVKLTWKSKASLGTTLMPLLGRLRATLNGGSLFSMATRRHTEGISLGASLLFYIVSFNSHDYA